MKINKLKKISNYLHNIHNNYKTMKNKKIEIKRFLLFTKLNSKWSNEAIIDYNINYRLNLYYANDFKDSFTNSYDLKYFSALTEKDIKLYLLNSNKNLLTNNEYQNYFEKLNNKDKIYSK